MLSRRFDELFERLTAAFCDYSSVPRTPERVQDLAAARSRLDRIRDEIAEERRDIERFAQLVDTYHLVDVSDDEIVRPGAR